MTTTLTRTPPPRLAEPAQVDRAKLLRRKHRKASWEAVLWIGPTLIVILGVIVYPMIEMIRISFLEVGRSGRLGDPTGFDNYVSLFARPDFLPIVGQTIFWLVAVVVGTIVLAWPTAMLLNARFPGRRIVRYAVLVPWAASLSISTLIFRWMVDPNYGIVNGILMRIGLIDEPIVWLGTPTLSWVTLIALGIFVSVPFNAYILLAGLQAIPAEVYEAAKLDGANAWQRWLHITRPMMSTPTFLAIILNIIGVFNSFALIWVLTRGGPGRSTQTTFTYMFDLAFGSRALGEAAALSVFNLLALAVIVVIYARFNRRALEEM